MTSLVARSSRRSYKSLAAKAAVRSSLSCRMHLFISLIHFHFLPLFLYISSSLFLSTCSLFTSSLLLWASFWHKFSAILHNRQSRSLNGAAVSCVQPRCNRRCHWCVRVCRCGAVFSCSGPWISARSTQEDLKGWTIGFRSGKRKSRYFEQDGSASI